MQKKTEEKQKAIKLRLEGYSLLEISRLLKVSKSSVSIWVRNIPRLEIITKEFKPKLKRESSQKPETIKKQLKTLKYEEKFNADEPYINHVAYKYKLSDGRYYLILKDNINRKTKITLFSRYIMEVHLNMILDKSIEVDHINGDKTDDNIANLQILTLNGHKIKSLEKFKKLQLDLVCDYLPCSKKFKRIKSEIKLRNFCSRKCKNEYFSKSNGYNQIYKPKVINEAYEKKTMDILNLYNNKHSSYQIAKILLIPRSTVYNIIKKYK